MKTKSKAKVGAWDAAEWNDHICDMGAAVFQIANAACIKDGTIPLTERQQFFVMQAACTSIRAAMLALLEEKNGGIHHYKAIQATRPTKD